MVCNTDNDPAQEREHLALLASYQVEGLVFNAAGSSDRELQALVEEGIPLVLLDRELSDVGVRLGETGLMGIDELDWCELVTPGITTLAQPTEAIGRAAVACLMRRREAGDRTTPARRVHFQASLIPRGSTRG
ncbi:substrate-binding domain-containing protein [Halomonas sp. 11-S5]|uniref:substrate-binding domain-containing protein n=1 Tax=Halomonas sp. 11-S5 TaxID=2994064 RepID=UPI0032AFCD13